MALQLEFVGVHLYGASIETTTAWLAGALPMSRNELIERSFDLTETLVLHTLDTHPNTHP